MRYRDHPDQIFLHDISNIKRKDFQIDTAIAFLDSRYPWILFQPIEAGDGFLVKALTQA
jgi:hypothetical protein